jgi:hypothetical protein
MNELDSKNLSPAAIHSGSSNLPQYEPPRLTVMNEDEVLRAFQVPVVATTWWVM